MIAREAWPLLLLALLAAWLAHAVCGYTCAVPLIASALIIPYLYREPVCRVPPSPLAVVSPVHGRVAAKETARDTYLGRMAVRIVIRKPVFSPFALRSPIEGRVVQQWYLPDALEPVAADGEAAVPVPRRSPATLRGVDPDR